MSGVVMQPGFGRATESQQVFRRILEAMSRPGSIVTIGADIAPPPPFSQASGAVLLALADATVVVALPADAVAAADWLRFHTGARPAAIGEADFVLSQTLPALDTMRQGSDGEPEGGATLILDVPAFDAGAWFRLTGPGIEHAAEVQMPLDNGFIAAWQENRARAPRGIDLLLCAGNRLIGLPRSVTIEGL